MVLEDPAAGVGGGGTFAEGLSAHGLRSALDLARVLRVREEAPEVHQHV